MAASSHTVHLTVPALPRFARLVRLAASDLATDAGFDIDDVEDLRTGVSELFSVLVDGLAGGDEVVVTFAVTDDRLEISGERSADGDQQAELDPIAQTILSACADEVDLATGDGVHRFRFSKRATSVSA